MRNIKFLIIASCSVSIIPGTRLGQDKERERERETETKYFLPCLFMYMTVMANMKICMIYKIIYFKN